MGFFYLIFFDNVFLLQLLYWKVVHRKYTDFLKLLLEQHGLHGLWCSFAIILKHPHCRHKCIQGMAAKCSHSIANALNLFTIKYHFPKMCPSAYGFPFFSIHAVDKWLRYSGVHQEWKKCEKKIKD